MLIVLAILALTSVLGGFALQPLRQRMDLSQAATRLDALLRTARAEALRTGRITLVRFDAGTRQLILPSQGRTYTLARSIAVSVTGAAIGTGSDKPTILFLGDGSSSGGVIELRSGTLRTARRIGWLTGRIDRSEGP
ncbi:GspH/FimT family pseudopilin [Methylobacterium sp. J-043]|nr:GspH/FimT family pseudopilin [Methylobacterium sp. J-043]